MATAAFIAELVSELVTFAVIIFADITVAERIADRSTTDKRVVALPLLSGALPGIVDIRSVAESGAVSASYTGNRVKG